MFNRISMTTIVVLLIVALASVAVGYGLWSKTLFIEGTVETGEVDLVFMKAFTDDDDFLNDGDKDDGDTGECALFGDGSCDPDASGHNVPRKDKDVGYCAVVDFSSGVQEFDVEIENAYPSYYCTVFFKFKNTGSVPVKVFSLAAVGPSISAGHVTAHFTDLEGVGQQIDPGEYVWGDLDLHVEQSAPEDGTLYLTGKILLGQWNEYYQFPWATNGEASVQDNSVELGEFGEAENGTQGIAAHGASALLPEGSSYDVTFQYHVCTWDSYTVDPGPGGQGWYDSFSVSTSSTPYWNLGLTDPLALGPDTDLDIGFLEGGAGWGNQTLDCFDGSDTVNLSSFAGGTYLNAVLDTATAPNNNGAYPSYGTITIEQVVVNP